MSKPYDAAGKGLLETDPAGWAAFLGVVRPPECVRLIDSELSSITAAADKVLHIAEPEPWILDFEFQSWRDPNAVRQLLKYNALLHDRHGLPVVSVLVVLAQSADTPAYSGRYRLVAPFGSAWDFRYNVVKVWEASADSLLSGPPALVPLAPVAAVEDAELPEIIDRVERRLIRDTDPTTCGRLLTAVGILLNLRYGAMTTEGFIRRYPEIREMGGFKWLIEEGREEGKRQSKAEGKAEGLRESLIIAGQPRFGSVPAEVRASLTRIYDTARLERMIANLYSAKSWED